VYVGGEQPPVDWNHSTDGWRQPECSELGILRPHLTQRLPRRRGEIVCVSPTTAGDVFDAGLTSAGAATLNLAATGGPASPTKVSYSLNQTLTAGSSPTFYSNSTDGTVFTTVLGAATTVTTAADLPAQMTWGIVNGTTAGAWQLQGKANGSGTATIKAGSSFTLTAQ
jgi:hypothetical protein